MKPLIVDLNSPHALSSELVGGKAAKLAFLRQRGLPIPDGFCVTTQAFALFPKIFQNPQFDQRLRRFFERLTQFASTPLSLIVRSSASCEDSREAAFPGIFESIDGIGTFDGLHSALSRCLSAVNEKKVLLYCRLKGIRVESIKMAALIQMEVHAEYAGVAFSQFSSPSAKLTGIHVEMNHGPSQAMLRGEQMGTAYLISGPADEPEIIHLSRGRSRESDVEKAILYRLAELVNQVNQFTEAEEVIEWVADKTAVFIVQSRPLAETKERGSQMRSRSPEQGSDQAVLLPAANQIGLKAAAMQLFKDLGWFTKRVVFAPPGTPMEIVEQIINTASFGSRWLTLRFPK